MNMYWDSIDKQARHNDSCKCTAAPKPTQQGYHTAFCAILIIKALSVDGYMKRCNRAGLDNVGYQKDQCGVRGRYKYQAYGHRNR